MRGAGKDDVGRDLLYRYYGQLELLELRFPIDEDHIRISFNWYDAFTESPISQYSLAYEKACVLFNIASILSFTAINQMRTEIDGMKKAYHAFQACTGLLNFINDNFLHAPSTDLSREVIRALSAVMLAQAQEVFVEKQIRDGGKASIVSKLAAETASLYHNANESLIEIVIAGNIDSVWGQFVQCKEKYFTSIAHYHQAVFEQEKGKHGIAVARFQVSAVLAKEATALAKTNSGQFARYPWLSSEPGTALLEAAKANLETTTDRLESSRKENDMIYHEQVVKDHALPPLAKLASAKPISLHDLYAGQDVGRIIGPDIFRKLIPLSIHESASLYSEEIAKLLRAEQERSDVADSELTTALDYLGLPKSLHQYKASDDRLAEDLARPPASLYALSKNAVDLDRTGSISSKFESITRLRGQLDEAFRKITTMLQEESRQCEGMRSKFGQSWTQVPSAQASQALASDVHNFKQSLAAAAQSDESMKAEYDTVAPEISELTNTTPDYLDIVFQTLVSQNISARPAGEGSLLDLEEDNSTDDIAIKVDQVDDALRKLSLVKKERAQTLQDLKAKARKDDISDVLMFNKKNPDLEKRVFASELEKFKPHQTRISATISRQEQLIEEMTVTFSSMLKNKSGQAKQHKWEVITSNRASKIKRLEKAAAVQRDITPGLTRAIKFYSDLDGLVKSALTQTKQFIQARQNEGRQMLDRVQLERPQQESVTLRSQLERMNLNGHDPSRPQPPPPPNPYNQYR